MDKTHSQIFDDSEIERNYSFDHMVAVGASGEEHGELWDPSGIAIDSETNQIYITEGEFSLARVSIFSESGDFLNCFKHEHIICPWGVAVHGSEMYLTDILRHTVSHYKLGGEIRFIAKLGCRGEGIGQFDFPNQLTVSTNAIVFVSDRDNHRIQILDSSLRYLKQISHQSMEHPCDVKVTTDSVYVLTLTGPFCIHVFSHIGDKIRSIITKGDGMLVTESFFFYIDSCAKFVISDNGSSQIKVFSEDGVLLHTLGEHGHELGKFERPYGIALSANQKCVVASLNENYGLQIFSTL